MIELTQRFGDYAFVSDLTADWCGPGRTLADLLARLDLPMAPLLPAFALLDVLCAGARQLVSLLVVGALVALISPRRRAPAGRARPNAPTTWPRPEKSHRIPWKPNRASWVPC